jgi:hypothetical protein
MAVQVANNNGPSSGLKPDDSKAWPRLRLVRHVTLGRIRGVQSLTAYAGSPPWPWDQGVVDTL